jgi:hypothetical protein
LPRMWLKTTRSTSATRARCITKPTPEVQGFDKNSRRI